MCRDPRPPALPSPPTLGRVGKRDVDGVGFRRGDVGTHTSRTIMLAELTTLFNAVPTAATGEEIAVAIRHANCLGKATASTRRLTHQRLNELYALDPQVPIYRVLRRLWDLDAPARPLLAITVAVARDPLLAASLAAGLAAAAVHPALTAGFQRLGIERLPE
jgi:hypothetical protein